MRPLQSASGMSLHRTSMLLEDVAWADTLLGPEEGTGGGDDNERSALGTSAGQRWAGGTAGT